MTGLRTGKRKAALGNATTAVVIRSSSSLAAKCANLDAPATLFEHQSAATSVLSIPSGISQDGRFIPMRYLYPMSQDHLLPLIEYNLWRAITTNILIVGHLHFMTSPVCKFTQCTAIFPNPYYGGVLLESLKPTALQQSTPHEDWIDLIPSPRMRDNAIRMQFQFSNLDLCADLLSGLVSGKQNDMDPGLRVWTNPWEPDGWEVSSSFVSKWGFLIKGCNDLFRSTNRWRAFRGEKPLCWVDGWRPQ